MFYQFYSKPSVASQKETAEKRKKALIKKKIEINPVEAITGNKTAKTWWGVAWNTNLETYADYQNRIDRGKSYCKNGLVIDLNITEGLIQAKVSGSDLYDILIKIDSLPESKWKKICSKCAQRVDSIAALVDGKFPKELSEVFMNQKEGLFPSPREIHMRCSCPDMAGLCKHLAAVLYGVGARLDSDPLLFFKLRSINPSELIKKSVDEKMKNLLANANKKSKRVIADKDIARLFDIETI
ncbi:MAG: SWIM zinc finger family protein [Christensenellaceae bacterium]|jgi:uncharacterized Zn finger protein|nr:SWIM zinc finger family protein [Christensenellaceae bacterium]